MGGQVMAAVILTLGSKVNKRVEKGVMVVKDGKGWGRLYQDGHETCVGWMNMEDAPIHDPKFCRSTTDVTYKGSPYTKELLTAKLVSVKRTTFTHVEIMEDQ